MDTFSIDEFDSKKSIYIEASAGTGKTYSIVGIVSKLVLEGIDLKKILIVTYTEKAAGELRDRIRDGLTKLITSSECADVRQKATEALNQLGNATIGTIHSFCLKTLEEFSFSANKPRNLSLIDENGVAEFIDIWLRDELENDQYYQNVNTELKNNKIIIDAYDFAQGVKQGITDGVKKYYLDKNWSENRDVIAIDDVYTKVNGKGKNKTVSFFTYDDCFEDAKKDEGSFFGKKLNNAGEVNGARLKKIDAFFKAKYIKHTIPVLYRKWTEYKSLRKQQTYNDMIRNVHEAVCEKDSSLLKSVQEKYSHAIIDEFQDTNQLQWNIFKTIFLNESHHIIVVGDPKQSIFSFQGADIHVYEKAIKDIKNGYVLATNYRSTSNLVEACNEMFKKDTYTDEAYFGNKFGKATASSRFCDTSFDGKSTKPFWIVSNTNNGKVDAKEFAAIAVQKIAECCSKDSNGKTRLQVSKKPNENEEIGALRNVTFKDFAILTRRGVEMDLFKSELCKAGIPYSRYKDDSLFTGKELKNWCYLLEAINASDFSNRNRKYLNKALASKFFEIPFEEVADSKYDDISNAHRMLFAELHEVARNRQWAKLVEYIFEKTKIESRLSTIDGLQSLCVYRQIGNYIVEYLYDNNCSLDMLIKHLKKTKSGGNNYVEIGTDYDCVQIMTMHASKGLEFPVVILGGNPFAKKDSTNIVHDNGNALLSLRIDIEKSMEEEMRLFYVGLTRARSLNILPKFENGTFISQSIDKFFDENKGSYYNVIANNNDNVKELVDKILSSTQQQNEAAEDQQKENVKKLAKNIRLQRTKKHSYSSLPHSYKKSENENELEKEDKEFVLPAEECDEEPIMLLNDENNRFDKEENNDGNDYNSTETTQDDYPKGANLGSAMHKVFELADFQKYAEGETDETAQNNEELKDLIIRSFREYGFKVDEQDEKGWVAKSVSIVWNTLNANLPAIKGKSISETNVFQLNSLEAKCRRAEAEFNFKVDDKMFLRNFCMGFIDLMFVRHNGQDDVYSILDWKSDSIDPAIYANAEEIKNIVDERYYVQRVLYSYCLIKWLKLFYNDMSEEDIFKNYFGGIYYVFMRATQHRTMNGIYSHTWDSWNDLKKEFEEIRHNYMEE